LKGFSVAIVLVLIGTIFLAGGVGATLNRTMSIATCEACGMEIEKEDISSVLVITPDQKEHWACCPICADVIALYYQDAEIQGKCFACGQEINVKLTDGNISTIELSGNKEFIKILAGGSCMKNKLVCSAACAQSVHESYDWAKDVPEKTLKEALVMGSNKLKTMTVDYRPLTIPAMNYAMLGVSAALFAAAPITWKIMNRRKKLNS
jgi:hypothetical protein